LKLITVLIPAFNYPDGVSKILDIFEKNPSIEIELIVADDSSNNQVAEIVQKYNDRNPGLVIYYHNNPSLGAVANWNSLLYKATGQYVLFMHHDEYPIGELFVDTLISKLSACKDIDILVLSCQIVSKGGVIRPHLPLFIQSLVLKYFPSYLFRRNVIGSPSCLIVRKSIYPSFDVLLQWFVDVDLYFQLFTKKYRWIISNNLQIASMTRESGSITNSLSDNLSSVIVSEYEYLREKYPNATFWLSPESNLFVSYFEKLAWVLLRVVTISIRRVFKLFT